MLLEKSGAGLAVLPALEVWNLLESNSGKRCIRRCDRKGDLSQKELWSELGAKLLREITLGEQGLLLSLCSLLPSALISAVFKAKGVSPGDILRIGITLREEVKCLMADFVNT